MKEGKLEIKENLDTEKYPYVRKISYPNKDYEEYVYVERREDGYYTPFSFTVFQSGSTNKIVLKGSDKRRRKFRKEEAIQIAQNHVSIK